ncbi:uncharacterized protein DUF1876 [Krasilnikovia cinnamomea]|uniref:Uncharacterized protein DUF1876 n=1 Tax=Krasilnikovia cinnamomea TaxID=349313 RepID=A0A4Q7ZQ38_9ACTN|nr:DUF1876 domain-containing protein [Krasilnikovia cinnamomea]RZU53218.1 uncharacterized protein DUF1876 [Krasilnikovia cinnamomea]
MTHIRTWNVEISISEHEDERNTYAEARLHSGARPMLRGEGQARRRPSDQEVPEIGDELAVARALSDLGHRLLEAAVADIEQFTDKPMRLAR